MMEDLLKGLIAIFIFLLVIVFLRRPGEPPGCRHNRIVSKIAANGIISKKMFNTKSHDNEKIQFTNGSYFEWDNDRYETNIFAHVNVGDSLVKLRGSLILSVYRNMGVDTFSLELDCEE